MSIRYHEECYGYSSKQTDCGIVARDEDKVVGLLNVAYHKLPGRKEAFIKMIEVLPAYKRQGIAKELIRFLAKNVPYENIDWGGTTDSGHLLKMSMDKEFGTSFKPVEKDEEPDSQDAKYDGEPNNDRYYADLEAWRKRNGFVDESTSNYSRGNHMKIKELKNLVRESIKKVIQESRHEMEPGRTHLPGLRGLADKIREKLPAIMAQYEHQITIDGLMKRMDVPESDKAVFIHMITDPENTGGIEYHIDDVDGWVTASGDDENMLNILGHEPTHQLFAPGEMDQTELGNPIGSTVHPDHEEDQGRYDDDTVGARPRPRGKKGQSYPSQKVGHDLYDTDTPDSTLMEALFEKHVGFKNLVGKLEKQGNSEESAKEIAYSIGKKKFGKKKMAKAASKGKPLSDKQAKKGK